MFKTSKLTGMIEHKFVNEKFDKSRKDFYINILQIKIFVQALGVIVAIFSFIIIGSTQVQFIVSSENTWYDNILNVSAVFIPLTIMLLILIFSLRFYPKFPKLQDYKI